MKNRLVNGAKNPIHKDKKQTKKKGPPFIVLTGYIKEPVDISKVIKDEGKYVRGNREIASSLLEVKFHKKTNKWEKKRLAKEENNKIFFGDINVKTVKDG